MNALILAAGYATRLYPLTLNKAKPLLEVGGKPIIEWLFDKADNHSLATVAVHDVGNPEAMKKYGTVTIDKDGVITNFEEKPKEPKSTLAAEALYYYSREALPLFTTYIAAGNNPAQPGLFLQWLYPRKPVGTFEIKGRWLDIVSKETLEIAARIFSDRAD